MHVLYIIYTRRQCIDLGIEAVVYVNSRLLNVGINGTFTHICKEYYTDITCDVNLHCQCYNVCRKGLSATQVQVYKTKLENMKIPIYVLSSIDDDPLMIKV